MVNTTSTQYVEKYQNTIRQIRILFLVLFSFSPSFLWYKVKFHQSGKKCNIFILPAASPAQRMSVNLFFSLFFGGVGEGAWKEKTTSLVTAAEFLAHGVKFLPPCLRTTELALCFHKHLRAASTSLVAPPVVFAAGSERKQSLAGTAGCLGNTLCHSSGLEQELAYPCQSAGRIWAMPCVNRLSDFHSDGSGISPTPPFSGKATPASLFLKAPRALLSSPISCLNYALLCAVVFFFYPPSSSPASPSPCLDPSPPSLLTVCLSLSFCEEMRTKILKFEVCCRDRPWLPPTTTTSHNPAPLLPSIVSSPEREYCVFDA